MRVAWVLVLGAPVLIASIGLAQLTSAQTPTSGPTDTPAPTVSPSPTPATQSTITIRFVQAGQPVVIRGNLTSIIADGVQCQFPIPGAAIDIGPIVTFTWPLNNGLPQPFECTKGPPTTLRFEFGSQYGFLATELIWSGNDVSVDIVVPAQTTAIPSPTGGPAAQLPSTGDASSDPHRALVAWGLFSVCSLAALAVIVLSRSLGVR
jgi:hypothetical protein